MTRKFRGQLEIDDKRGVIYFHEELTGATQLRICSLPTPIPAEMLDITHMYGCSWRGASEYVEGYWRKTKADNKSRLPFPVWRLIPWIGRAKFMQSLEYAQHYARSAYMKGHSTCRLCGIPNGSAEFEFFGWRWPSGLMHYVNKHNVKPSRKFREFILKCAEKLPNPGPQKPLKNA